MYAARVLRWPFAAAAFGFVCGEAALAGGATFAAGAGIADSAAAALGSAAVVAFCVLLLLWPLDRVLRSEGARALGLALYRALAAERSVTLACALGGSAIGLGVFVVIRLAPRWVESMSERFALAATVLASVAVVAVGLLCMSAVGHALGQRVRLRASWQRALDRVAAPVLLGAAVAVALWRFVTPSYVAAPLCACVMFAFGLVTTIRPRPLSWAVGATFSSSVLLLAGIQWLPPAARETILYRAPYTSLAIGALQAGFDRDGRRIGCAVARRRLRRR